MRTPDADELLMLWERGFDAPSPRRALMLLAAALPGADANELAAMHLGRRNELLLQMRERLFGSRLPLVTRCPVCGEQLESVVHIDELLGAGAPQQTSAPSVRHGAMLFHVPTAGDIVDLPASSEHAQLALLERCVECGDADALAALPADAIAIVAAALAAADPRAETLIGMACAACSHRWEACFDIASFLWRELDVWARRTLREVHALARAYAWREADVLAMSPTRRQIYLQLSGA